MSQAEKYQKQLASKAQEHLDSIPADQKPVLGAAHNQLLSWLVTMNEQTRNAANIVNSDMVLAGMDSVDKLPPLSELEAFRNLWTSLDQDLKASIVNHILKSVFAKVGLGGMLVSRGTEYKLWEQTGFHIDQQVVCAKVGANPYQPIGFDDGKHFVQTPGAKRLWTRDFRIAVLFPYSAAFEVATNDTKVESTLDQAALKTILGWFEETELTLGTGKTPEETAEINEQALDTVELARLRMPQLDAKLKEVEASPELNGSLAKADLSQLIRACAEWCRMHIADNDVAQDIASKTIVVKDREAERTAMMQSLLSAFKSVDEASSANALSAFKIALPEFTDVQTVEEAIEKLNSALEKRLNNVKPSEQPPIQAP